MIGAAGVAFVAGLVLLAALVVVTVRQGVERRFAVAVGAYVAGLVVAGTLPFFAATAGRTRMAALWSTAPSAPFA